MKRAALGLLTLALLSALACSNTDSNTAASGASGPSSCLDQPGELARPPEGQLPCELIPPDLSL